MDKKVKRNLKIRELLIWLFTVDTVAFYLFNVFFIHENNNYITNVCQYITIILRIIFDYFNIFFIWIPIRYEKYSNNVSSYILEYTVLVILQFIIFVIGKSTSNINLICGFLCIYVIVFLIIRIKVNSYVLSDVEGFYNQIEKDLYVNFLLVAYYSVTNIFILVAYKNNIAISYFMIILSFFISVLCFTYYLNIYDLTKKKLENINGIILLHMYFIGSVYAISSIHVNFSVVLNICYIIFSCLLCALYVNGVNNIINKIDSKNKY